ncbi:MAG: ParA family protein [Chloroflexi bacterium]|nr:ParA family protein [Chloroflexota bacterium]
MTRIYALVNQKGGVGKTTTAISLGAYLALLGQRVLLVDLDPQANATACLGIDHDSVAGGTYDALIGRSSAADLVLHNPKLQLSLLPSSPALAGATVELVDMPERERLLRTALSSLAQRFDYVLIDSPPSLGLLTVNGLMAAETGILIPVQCEYLALEGLTQLMQTLGRVRSGLFPGLAIRGLILTMFDARTSLSHQVADEVRSHFPGKVFKSVIPRSVRLAEAPSHGLPISAYDPSSPGGLAYRALAEELMRGDGAPIPRTAPGRN